MKRIFSYKSALAFGLASVFFFLLVWLIFKDAAHILLSYVKTVLYSASVAIFLCPFLLPNQIKYDDVHLEIENFPLLTMNSTYKRYGGIISRNNTILFREVEGYRIVSLSKVEKRRFVGHRHLFSKYLEIKIHNSQVPKYIYLSIYTQKQAQKLLDVIDLNIQSN